MKIKIIIVLCVNIFANKVNGAAIELAEKCNTPFVNSIDRTSVANESYEANLYDGCQGVKHIVCLDTLKMMLSMYKNVTKYWTDKTNLNKPYLYRNMNNRGVFNSNLQENFKDLLKKHTEYLASFKSETHQVISKIDSFSSVQSSYNWISKKEKIYVHTQKLKKELYNLDHQFLEMLDFELKGLLAVLPHFKTLLDAPSCSTFKPQTDKIKADADSWINAINNMRGYIIGANKKRDILFSLADNALRGRSLLKYFDLSGTQTIEAQTRLHRAIYVIDKSVEIDNWWLSMTSDGIAGRLHTLFNQYHKPLRIIKGHLSRIEDYKKELTSLGPEYGSSVQTIINQLVERERLLLENLDYIESTGWQGMLREQKIVASNILDDLSERIDGCSDFLNIFNSTLNQTHTENNFYDLEDMYMSLLKKCARKVQ